MSDLSTFDLAALAWMALAWVGYAFTVDRTRLRERSISSTMNRYRVRWMRAMLGRELRIIDTSIVGNILRGVAFFASTAILAVGGLAAALSASEQAVTVVSDLPFSTDTTRAAWELKVLVLIGVFVYAFFKLAWSFRLFTNCSILIGAAPLPPVDDARASAYAQQVGSALNFASENFNAGMRGYFFALAAIWWFLNPLAFMLATALVVGVIYRREFHSRTLAAIRGGVDLAQD